ncbi:hypothetical protein PEBR_02510 [Penicillium brasilianum]|uniref:Uncharacterized protein n=1 Tax=Penicillium brasilianum TaxID=104259 RepID=A0A1S9RZ30_PENBI|nr:hypothetical protein PEBR_02510 [Penicillium brasilianum]
MHESNDLLLDVDRTIDKKGPLCRPPWVECNRPGEDGFGGHLVIVGPHRLAADRKDYLISKVTKEKRRKPNRQHQFDLTITALRRAALTGSLRTLWATLCTLSSRRLGTQVYRGSLEDGCGNKLPSRLIVPMHRALPVAIPHALQPDEGRYAPLTRIQPPNYTVPPPSSMEY